MFYIVGLGNPGEKYDNTRHNIGRDILFTLAKDGFSEWYTSKLAQALGSRGTLSGVVVELVVPETFMNKSGDTVRYLKDKQGAQPKDLIVIYDDVDLPLGELKVSVGRGDGGHNGIKSIIGALGSKDFVRIRVGVAHKSFWTGKTLRPAGGGKMQRHVLGKFTKGEVSKVAEVTKLVTEALEMLVTVGAEKTMNKFN